MLKFTWKNPSVITLIMMALMAGCSQTLSDLGVVKPITAPPEYRQKVGLYVHEEAEEFYFPGTTTLDVSDLMSFHLQQVLPYNSETLLKQIFTSVELKSPGPKVEFKSPDLVGYFEIKVKNARYDYPDTGATSYRAEIRLSVEFKTMEHESIWVSLFQGDGIAFTNTNRSLTRFGREAGTALEDAFQDATHKMQEGILSSERLKTYFRSLS